MITKKKLLALNKKEIEALLNSTLVGLETTSIYPSEVKEAMLAHLEKQIEGLPTRAIDYNTNAFTISVGRARIVVKIGAKSTGDIVAVSRLRNKPVKKVGKFTVSEVTYKVNNFWYTLADESTWEVKIGSSCSGDDVYIEKFDVPLAEVLNPEFLMNKLNEQKKAYAEDPYSRDNTYRSFRDELELSIAQPILKRFFLSFTFNSNIIKKEELTMVPKSHYDSLPEEISNQDLFSLIVKIMADINSELIEDVIKNQTFVDCE